MALGIDGHVRRHLVPLAAARTRILSYMERGDLMALDAAVDTVIVPLDHPFVKEGRFASLLVRDRELADSLADGLQALWRKAMRNLREIDVDPRRADPRPT